MENRLRNFVLQQTLLASAAMFDLREHTERQRSNAELVKLFEDVVCFIRPKCCIEVGAYTAEFSVRIKRKLPSTRVIAFEANPYNYEEIRKNCDFSQLGVDYRQAAIAASGGIVDFFVMKKWPSGEVRQAVAPDNSLNQRNLDGFDYEKVQVRSVALGQMLGVNEFIADDFCLWIDAEGAAREVLTGAEPVLSRVAALLVEVEDRAHWRDQWLSQDVINFMADRDLYQPTGPLTRT